MSSARQGISDLPEICLKHGINHAVITPGSRNAPLIMAFAKHPQFHCYSITDERSAGYYAMGMALHLQKPVALICTSGTAAINFYPAITEAFYMQIPLLVLTADRPPEWIDQNDGQTIRQKGLYGSMVKKSFELPTETAIKEDLWYFRRMISEAINTSVIDSPGPVHINIPLREPLYTPLPVPTKDLVVSKVLKYKKIFSEDQLESIREKWNSYRKKLIVCGHSQKNEELNTLLESLAKNNQAIVFAENVSNLYSPYFIDTPEQFFASINENEEDFLKPELLITIGGSVVSKRLKKYLRQYKPLEQWHVDENNFFIDTFQSLSLNPAVDPIEFFRQMDSGSESNVSYCDFASAKFKQTDQKREAFIREAPFSDLAAYHTILKNIPDGYSLHLGNSTPVRYVQLFRSRPGIDYHSNRGTSGIDGTVSTAAGYAMVSGKPTLLLVGDLAYIYDSNALWNNKLPSNLRIIVFENDGGNIFKLIDTTPEIDVIKHFFETPHHVDIEKLSQAYGVQHMKVSDNDRLEQALVEFFKPNDRPVVLSIKTSGEESAKTFKKYFQFISQQQ
jgi:2-succinyl-5-enolpyruvyl-6-hydroxy-3-cyclohexene-1-carboxylate synthase